MLIRSLILSLVALYSGTSLAAPTLDFSPAISLCDMPCRAVGGVALDAGELGFLVVDQSAADDEGVFVRVDTSTGDVLEQTPLGGSTGYDLADIVSDGNGGAWMVGTRIANGKSIPGRWHTDSLTEVVVPSSFDGNTDVALLSVVSSGAGFGVTNDVLATRIDSDGTPINLAAGLTTQLPTTITDANADGSLAVGNARLGGLLTLALWDTDALIYQDNATGGNGVVGQSAVGVDVILGLRVAAGMPEVTAIVDPAGTPVLVPIAMVTTAELFGIDGDGGGFGFGSIEGDAALFDLNDMDVTTLDTVGLSGFSSLVAMDQIGGTQWVITLDGPPAFTLAQINAMTPDTDGDGVLDDVDNCLESVNPDQIDADADQIGNRCDADFNNDCVVNVIDLGILRTVFFTADAVADLNLDGVVNVVDLGILRTVFFAPPGPGAPGNACAAN